jgi:hypothetical protein
MDSTLKAHEERAGAAGALLMKTAHTSVQLLPERSFKDKFGMLRVELDAVVIADACALLVEAKHRLDTQAVDQAADAVAILKCAPHGLPWQGPRSSRCWPVYARLASLSFWLNTRTCTVDLSTDASAFLVACATCHPRRLRSKSQVFALCTPLT